MSEPAASICRLEPVHPDRAALQLCVAALDREDGCRGRSRESSLIRCGFHVLVLCTAGHGDMRIDTEVVPIGPGTVLWLRPGQVHTPVPDVVGTAICFTDQMADAVVTWVTGGVWRLGAGEVGAVSAIVDLLAEEYRRYVFGPTGSTLAHGELLLAHLLQSLLLRLGQLAGEPIVAEGQANATAEAFLAVLDTNLAELHSVEQVAAQLHCSPRTLSRACQDSFGLTPKEVLDARKAREARRLLEYTDLSVQAVGRRVGFEDPANFGRFFARNVGMTPGAFRARR